MEHARDRLERCHSDFESHGIYCNSLKLVKFKHNCKLMLIYAERLKSSNHLDILTCGSLNAHST